MVGLPYETDDLFEETYVLLNSIDFAYLHVFIYSKRKGTIACEMKHHVKGDIAKERSKKLHELEKEKSIKYMKTLIENNIVLYAPSESFCEKTKTASGTSDRYIKVYFKQSKDEKKTIKRLLPKKIYLDGIYCSGDY